jgi:SpoVK/Ycf46/Vps4 family AAA+-type ATPase
MSDEQLLAALGARRIAADTGPDDLVLPEESGRKLGWIANWLAQPPFMFREWGLGRHVDGGLRALFRGASGTGKTMAAVALAKSTGLSLFSIDLAAVQSEYIAETEKKLRDIFDAARKANAILLFDEADALLGKRSEVQDSHDRHANIEIAYLLRRIEPFEGLAIVTSNATSAIDEEVLGRIDVMVEFPRPDEAARQALWNKLLGSVKLPQASDLDLRTLANDYELTGAEILRCVRLASSIAATEERSLDMALLLAAAKERIAMRAG